MHSSKEFIRKKIGSIVLILVVAFSGIFFYRNTVADFVWQTTRNAEVALFIGNDDLKLKYDIAHYYFNGGAYDLVKSEKYYRELVAEAEDHVPLYQLGRIHFVNGNLAVALDTFNQQLELYPEEKRVHYMLGLTNIYREEFSAAVADFEAFVAWEPDEWAGYNDLAWAYFKNGQFKEAAEIAQEGLKQFPDNLWLNNMAGVALWNLGDLRRAEAYFLQAQEGAERISVGGWGGAYPGNNPVTYETSLENMRQSIAENLKGVRIEIYN